MPQCVAQQDQSTWLSTMTRCTSKQCTSHFGIICTHHQWLTQLSCLSTEFSPEIVKAYLPFCSRSILAKAQLFQWIRTITGRTWLVDVGDANRLQWLSSSSLSKGYATVGVTNKAPTCLSDSVSALSMEPFQRAMASCGFTATTEHVGNAARPWEYREALQSMIALDFETVGYDLTQHRIEDGDYFDKACFCAVFRISWEQEPCSGSGLAITRERLWMNATCGPTAVPSNWTDGLKMTPYGYIPIEDWRWPDCVTAMPKKVIGLAERCATDACEVDSNGYCTIKRAVDRACFCRSINYDSCSGACHHFEKRIDYVNWLHDLCGSEPKWHGLPKHWHQLAAPTALDMVPWRWTVKPSKYTYTDSVDHLRSPRPKPKQTYAFTEWKLGSLILINAATLLAAYFGPTSSIYLQARKYLPNLDQGSWFLPGLAMVALHLFANWANAGLIQSTLGYEDIPVAELVLLWCSMPRLTWLTVLLVGIKPYEVTSFSMIASFLFAETMLQGLSAYHIAATVNYGLQHHFYSDGMARLQEVSSARLMYAGALMWVMVITAALILLVQAIRGRPVSARGWREHSPTLPRSKYTTPITVEEYLDPFNECWTRLEANLVCHWTRTRCHTETTPLTAGFGADCPGYGTLLIKGTTNDTLERNTAKLYLLFIISMFFLWIAQWLFWAGFIGISLEKYVLICTLGPY